MFERYTESARRALFFSRYEASELGSLTIETEHLLLGLLRSRRGIVDRLLDDADVSPDDLSAELKRRSEFREKVPTSVEIPFSDEARRVLQFAAEEADRLQHRYIGTEHLLLGLLRVEHSVAGSALAAHGLRADPVRKKLVELLKENPAFVDDRGAPSAQSPGPAASVEGVRQVLLHLRESVHDKETRQLIDRICRDLAALSRRLS